VVLSAQLLTEAILELDFLIYYEVEMSFPEQVITLRNNEVFDIEFTGAKEPSVNSFCDLGLMSNHSQNQHLLIKITATQRISPRVV